jgi:hypothetical protein
MYRCSWTSLPTPFVSAQRLSKCIVHNQRQVHKAEVNFVVDSKMFRPSVGNSCFCWPKKILLTCVLHGWASVVKIVTFLFHCEHYRGAVESTEAARSRHNSQFARRVTQVGWSKWKQGIESICPVQETVFVFWWTEQIGHTGHQYSRRYRAIALWVI